MALSSDQIIRITTEATLGKTPDETDTAEESEFRAKVSDQVAEIKAAGLIVEIPFDIVDDRPL